MSVLEQAEKSRGLVTQQSLGDNLKWDTQRSNIILGMNVVQIFYPIIIVHFPDQMVGSGQLWVDSQGTSGYNEYWAPSIFTSTLVSG